MAVFLFSRVLLWHRAKRELWKPGLLQPSYHLNPFSTFCLCARLEVAFSSLADLFCRKVAVSLRVVCWGKVLIMISTTLCCKQIYKLLCVCVCVCLFARNKLYLRKRKDLSLPGDIFELKWWYGLCTLNKDKISCIMWQRTCLFGFIPVLN